MIRASEVMPLILAAVPSFHETWLDIDADHAEDDGSRLCYLDAGYVARHLVTLLAAGKADEVAAAFAVVERLHVEGDEYVRELATIGYLEDIQGYANQHKRISAESFERFLGPESRRWWKGVDDFWAGRTPPPVRPVD